MNVMGRGKQQHRGKDKAWNRSRKSLSRGGVSRLARSRSAPKEEKLFVIVCEGESTEPDYFRRLFREHGRFELEVVKKRSKSSPRNALAEMRKYLKRTKKDSANFDDDEAWIVIDRDNWPVSQLEEVRRWSEESETHDFAISDPKFEYWLILHYEDGSERDAKSSKGNQCENYLRDKYIPHYEKNRMLPGEVFERARILSAIERAKLRMSTVGAALSPSGWAHQDGLTTLYRLVERVLDDDAST